MHAFIVDTVDAFDTAIKPALIRGLGENRSGLFRPALPTHHCVAVIAARARKMGFDVFALRDKLVVQRRGCDVPQQIIHSDPKKGNKWMKGLPVTRANALAATMRVVG